MLRVPAVLLEPREIPVSPRRPCSWAYTESSNVNLCSLENNSSEGTYELEKVISGSPVEGLRIQEEYCRVFEVG